MVYKELKLYCTDLTASNSKVGEKYFYIKYVLHYIPNIINTWRSPAF